MLDFPIGTAVVCHDAGAANIVISELVVTGRTDWRACMQGPAAKLWNAAYPKIDTYNTIEAALAGAPLLVTGTGWASDIEYDAIRMAKYRGIRSVAFIDHWVNYPDRFIRHGETVWPDEFYVTDNYALEIAKQAFPGKMINQKPNRYVETQLRGIGLVDRSGGAELLYVLEPMRSNWGRNTLGEFQALEYFVSCLPRLGLPENLLIRLRPHPSDYLNKYVPWISANSNLNIKIDTSVDISESLGRSSWVAGCESFALVLGMMAGRKVFCTLPPWAPNCRLPHIDLIHLRNFHKMDDVSPK
jgi:hypothetical protein